MHRREIHRRVMEILCAGSCRGNVRWYALEREEGRGEGVGSGKLVSLSFFPPRPPLSFFFSPEEHRAPLPGRRRHRKPADEGVVMGYGVPSTPNTPIAAAPRYLPRIITANKGKKRNVLDSGNVTSACSLPKYRGSGLPHTASFVMSAQIFLPSVYSVPLDRHHFLR